MNQLETFILNMLFHDSSLTLLLRQRKNTGRELTSRCTFCSAVLPKMFYKISLRQLSACLRCHAINILYVSGGRSVLARITFTLCCVFRKVNLFIFLGTALHYRTPQKLAKNKTHDQGKR